jgi:hypothetical protein
MPAGGFKSTDGTGVNDPGYNQFFANAKISTTRYIAVSILILHE